MSLPPAVEHSIGDSTARLRAVLGDNLHSCLLYGSAVRGNLIAGVSDINLLIVLRESTPEAHAAIADVLRGPLRVEPFILGLTGIERSFRAFAIKFRSIQRNYRVLHGIDPLANLTIDERTLRFECEQTLRNLRLRSVHAFVAWGREGPRYARYLTGITADLFVVLSEILRLDGAEIPHDLPDRLPTFAAGFEVDAGVLRDLLELKRQRGATLSATLALRFHSRLLPILDKAARRIEERWA